MEKKEEKKRQKKNNQTDNYYGADGFYLGLVSYIFFSKRYLRRYIFVTIKWMEANVTIYMFVLTKTQIRLYWISND